MKTITRTLLVLFVLSAGFAWAATGGEGEILITPVEQTDAQQNVEVQQDVEIQEEITAEDLENMDSDLVEMGGTCCIPDCFEERLACRAECGFGDQGCRNQCNADFNACKNNC